MNPPNVTVTLWYKSPLTNNQLSLMGNLPIETLANIYALKADDIHTGLQSGIFYYFKKGNRNFYVCREGFDLPASANGIQV